MVLFPPQNSLKVYTDAPRSNFEEQTLREITCADALTAKVKDVLDNEAYFQPRPVPQDLVLIASTQTTISCQNPLQKKIPEIRATSLAAGKIYTFSKARHYAISDA